MLRSIFWKPYSRLLIVSDNVGWVIDEESKALQKIADKLGIKSEIIKRVRLNVPQVIYYTSQFSINDEGARKNRYRICIDYLHGRPEHGESYRKCLEILKNQNQNIHKIRVSTRDKEKYLVSMGISKDKIQRIPIGINLERFSPATTEKKLSLRKQLKIPEDAVVIGSFQKDGTGWGEGDEPKYIKGPDIFLQVIEMLKKDVPNLWVLLSGPARGYIKNGLEKIGVPYHHKYFEDASDVASLYDALDMYIITSREEGGPKACLEAMAKGVPLVTTAVGQCKDLVMNGKNGLMFPLDNVIGLANGAKEIITNKKLTSNLIKNGFSTAKENSYEAQLPLWKKFFEGSLT